MVIDSHQHFWHYDPVRYDWITDEMQVLQRDFLPQHLLPELTSNGIDGCIAVQAEQSEQETRFLLALADQHSQILGVVGWVDLTAPNVSERIENLSQNKKLRGIRHIVQSEPDDFLLCEDFCRGVGVLKHFGFTYDILIYPRQLPAAIRFAERFPDQKFVLDHIAKPSIRTGEIKPWSANVRALAANPHVYCKVSGMVTEAKWRAWSPSDFTPYLDIVFEAFGADRILFGSDWPVCLVAANYKDVRGIVDAYIRSLPHDQQQKILGLNAIHFYDLKTMHE